MSSCKFITVLCLSAFLAAFLTACAAPPKPITAVDLPTWSGRIAVKVESDPVQHLSVGFSLQGSDDAGVLGLFTPLGGKAAEVKWQSQPTASAAVTTDKGVQNYANVNAALAQITGADFPVAELFAWLKGNAASGEASHRKSAWRADLTRHGDGRITAVRDFPAPRMEIRVVLEQ